MNIENRKKYRYFFSNVIAFLFGSMGTKLIGFLMVPLYTNLLLPQEYGEIDLLLSLAGVISPFLALGIHEGIMRFCLDKDANHKLVFSIGLRVFLVSSGIFGLLLMFSSTPVISEHREFLYFYCILQECMTIILCYIRGKDDIKLYSFLGFLSAFIVAALNILFIAVLHWGVVGYKISMILSPAVTSIAAILLGNIQKEWTVKLWDKKLASEMMKYSVMLIPNALLWGVINASDRFFVSYMCGNAENGLYAVAYKLPTLLNVVAAIVMQSWQMSAINEHENNGSKEFCNHMYRWLIFVMGLATLGLLLINRTALRIYVGQEYKNAWVYSPPLIAAFFMGALGTFWGAFYIAEKNTAKYLNSALAGAIVNVVLNFSLIAMMGTVGAGIATAVSYLVVFVVRTVGIKNRVGLKCINKPLISSVVCIIISMCGAYLPDVYLWVIGCCSIALFLIWNRDQLKQMLTFVVDLKKQLLKK